ncbi:MAG: hypothetical protein LVQ95_04420 [Candidatus Micrarchaeales archaeon]|nr:hypothetical protein [Candidatus Micrarchaeales archaeon]
MKAQIAMIEVFLSSLALSVVAGTAISISYSASVAQRGIDFGMQNVFYDFTGILYRNVSYESCILSSNKECISALLADINSEYSFDGSLLAINNKSTEVGSFAACMAEKTECFPVSANGTFVQVCLTVCGG